MIAIFEKDFCPDNSMRIRSELGWDFWMYKSQQKISRIFKHMTSIRVTLVEVIEMNDDKKRRMKISHCGTATKKKRCSFA